jgi:hypothetical protein
MPLNIIIGLVALLVALVSYSIGTWGAFRAKALGRRHVVYLWVGFAFDVLATAMMAISAGGLDVSPLSHLLHTVVAFAAMFGMLAIAVAGSRALATLDDATLVRLPRWVVAPWALWVFVFIWGLFARGSEVAR